MTARGGQVRGALGKLGATFIDGAVGLGSVTLLIGGALRRLTRAPRRTETYLYQLVQLGVRSLPLTLATSAFVGMVLAYQFGYGLSRFGARLFIGQATVTSLVRELAPILIALVVGGRVGAGIAAELGGMAVSEQIAAVQALGADPLQRLVAPRLVAVMVSLPLLSVAADVTGFLSSMLVARWEYDVGPRLYVRGVLDFVTLADLLSGLIKTVVFALLVSAIACREGLRATGGTEGVGRATTRSVVATALAILAADLLLTKLLLTWT